MASASRFALQHRVPLAGSEKKPFAAEAMPMQASAASLSEGDPITVSVILAPKSAYAMPEGTPPERLTREEFASRHGVSPTSVQMVQAFAQEFGLTMEPAEAEGRCTAHLSGSVAAIEKAFGVSLKSQVTAAGTFRVREGAIYLPEELQEHVLAVLGLDNRPQAKPHFRIAKPHADNVSYTPVQVGALYGFPSGATASGQTIGLIELGGGYREADVTAYFQTLGDTCASDHGCRRRRREEYAGRCKRRGWRGDAGYRGVRLVATGAKIAVYFCAEHGPGICGRGDDCRARHEE